MPLVDGTAIPTTSATAYTAPSGASDRGVIIVGVRVTNITLSPATLTLWVVPNGGTEGDAYKVVTAVSIPADGVDYVFLKAVMLDPGDFVRWVAGTASALSGRIDGVKMEV
jgi:hypothetical protein